MLLLREWLDFGGRLGPWRMGASGLTSLALIGRRVSLSERVCGRRADLLAFRFSMGSPQPLNRRPAFLLPRWLTAALLTAVSLQGCGGGSSDEPRAGNCAVQTAEPVLTIQKVTDSTTGAPITKLQLLNPVVNGLPVDPSAFVLQSEGLTVVSGAIFCSAPCGFWRSEGRISFTATAPGFTAQEVAVDARYGSRAGSCPAVLSGGTRIELALSASRS